MVEMFVTISDGNWILQMNTTRGTGRIQSAFYPFVNKPQYLQNSHEVDSFYRLYIRLILMKLGVA
jgi:hypothetical protein